MGCERMGVAHGNSETRLIKGLMNSKPPVGKAMPYPRVPPRQIQTANAQCPHPLLLRREGVGSVNI